MNITVQNYFILKEKLQNLFLLCLYSLSALLPGIWKKGNGHARNISQNIPLVCAVCMSEANQIPTFVWFS